MSRPRLFLIWMFLVVITPVLLVVMLIQLTVGSSDRALKMAVAFDEVGNCLFGGDPTETISARTGNALIAGKAWAKIAAPIIDAIFGDGHCLHEAALHPEKNS